MLEVKTVEIKAIAERQVEWTPKGYSWSSKKTAIIRDGKLEVFPDVQGYFVEADPDGCIEFFQAIKQAIAETRENS